MGARKISRDQLVESYYRGERDFDGAIFAGANLEDLVLHGISLKKADLRAACLDRSLLWSADLRGAMLDAATLVRTDLRLADLRHARLSRTILRETILTDADLRDASVIDASLSGADLTRALVGADICAADLFGLGQVDSVEIPSDDRADAQCVLYDEWVEALVETADVEWHLGLGLPTDQLGITGSALFHAERAKFLRPFNDTILAEHRELVPFLWDRMHGDQSDRTIRPELRLLLYHFHTGPGPFASHESHKALLMESAQPPLVGRWSASPWTMPTGHLMAFVERVASAEQVIISMPFNSSLAFKIFAEATQPAVVSCGARAVRLFRNHPFQRIIDSYGFSWQDYFQALTISARAAIIDISYLNENVLQELRMLAPQKPCLLLCQTGAISQNQLRKLGIIRLEQLFGNSSLAGSSQINPLRDVIHYSKHPDSDELLWIRLKIRAWANKAIRAQQGEHFRPAPLWVHQQIERRATQEWKPRKPTQLSIDSRSAALDRIGEIEASAEHDPVGARNSFQQLLNDLNEIDGAQAADAKIVALQHLARLYHAKLNMNEEALQILDNAERLLITTNNAHRENSATSNGIRAFEETEWRNTLQSSVLLDQALVLRALRRLDEAWELADLSERRFLAAIHPQDAALATWAKFQTLALRSRWQDAELACWNVFRLGKVADDDALVALGLHGVSICLMNAGLLVFAKPYLRRAHELYTELNDPRLDEVKHLLRDCERETRRDD